VQTIRVVLPAWSANSFRGPRYSPPTRHSMPPLPPVAETAWPDTRAKVPDTPCVRDLRTTVIRADSRNARSAGCVGSDICGRSAVPVRMVIRRGTGFAVGPSNGAFSRRSNGGHTRRMGVSLPRGTSKGSMPPAISRDDTKGSVHFMVENAPYGGQPGPQPPYGGQPGPQPPYPQQYPAYPGAAQESKVVAGILGILLGSLGIHSFYLGRAGRVSPRSSSPW